MKKLLFILLLSCCYKSSFGQLYDDFTDLNFSENPEWLGDHEKFVVNEAAELQLNDIDFNSPAYLSTPSNIASNALWSFDIKMDFNPSSSNYMDVFLIANKQNLLLTDEAYFIRIGGTEDNVSLLKRTNGTDEILILGIADATDMSSQDLHIEISYNDLQWELNYSNNSLESNAMFAEDELSFANEYFGFVCYYTSTRKDKFYIDNIDISGVPYQDLKEPEIIQCNISSASNIFILFDEELQSNTVLKKENYLLNGQTHPKAISTVVSQKNAYILHFKKEFLFNTNQYLHVEQIADLAGNTINPIDTSFYKSYGFPHDIVFTEVMADPSPPVLLAESEYLEIYNRANYPITLKGFQLHIDDQIKNLPDTVLPARSYALLCHNNNIDKFSENILRFGFSSFSIKNDAATLILKNNDQENIDVFLYASTTYSDDNKADGGWSLEKIDTNVFCEDVKNWAASTHHNGGSPGEENTVKAILPDEIYPYISKVKIISPHEIVIHHNEKFISEFGTEDLWVNHHIGMPVSVTQQSQTKTILWFEDALQTGILYELSFKNSIEDCNGNKSFQHPILFALAETLSKEDLIFNEVLFNPYPNAVDFIEIYNRSNKVIDLKGLRIARYENANLDQVTIITDEEHLLYPKQYSILCEDSANVSKTYRSNKNAFIEVSTLPTMADDEGSIALCFPWMEIIDTLYYNEDMHFSHIKDPEGVSLERIYQDLPETNEKVWHSASFQSGFATPGFKNSQHNPALFSKMDILSISPKIISPNNDGHNDYLSITYTLKENNATGNLIIYNQYGQFIRKISDHLSLGSNGFFRWDGDNEQGQTVLNGIYIIVFEFINESGHIVSTTKTCVVRKQ